MSMMPNSQEQERARYAFEQVKNIPGPTGKEYRSLVLQAPERIHQCGLLQTLAFHLSKEKDSQHSLFLQHLLGWFFGKKIIKKNNIRSSYKKLLDLSSTEIMQKTQESKKLVFWLKRFAERFNEKNGTKGE